MPEMTLAAEANRMTGSRPSGRLRSDQRVPAVVYGGTEAPISVSVARRDLRLALSGAHGTHALINLQVGDSRHLVIVKEMQRNPVRNEVIHVDFLRVSRDAMVSAEVTINLVGDAHEVRLGGGKVEQQLFKLNVSAKPDDIPADITVDISSMAPGQILRVDEIDLPEGVVATTSLEEIVAVGHVNKRLVRKDAGAGGADEEGDEQPAAGEDASEAVEGSGSEDGGAEEPAASENSNE